MLATFTSDLVDFGETSLFLLATGIGFAVMIIATIATGSILHRTKPAVAVTLLAVALVAAWATVLVLGYIEAVNLDRDVAVAAVVGASVFWLIAFVAVHALTPPPEPDRVVRYVELSSDHVVTSADEAVVDLHNRVRALEQGAQLALPAAPEPKPAVEEFDPADYPPPPVPEPNRQAIALPATITSEWTVDGVEFDIEEKTQTPKRTRRLLRVGR